MIQAIQCDTSLAVSGMREGAVHVGKSVALVEGAQEALRNINQRMADTVHRVSDISHSSGEQREAMQQLAMNVERVSCRSLRPAGFPQGVLLRLAILRLPALSGYQGSGYAASFSRSSQAA